MIHSDPSWPLRPTAPSDCSTPPRWWSASSSAPPSSSSPRRSTATSPPFRGVLSVWIAAGILTLFGALVCAAALRGLPAHRRRLRLPQGDALPRLRLSVGLGDVLERALRHHRRVQRRLRALRRRTSFRSATPESAPSPSPASSLSPSSTISASGRAAGCRPWSPSRRSSPSSCCSAWSSFWVRRAARTPPLPLRPRRRPSANSSSPSRAALFAFGGWHMVTYTAGETRDPVRTIPRALLIGTLTVTACYVALNAAYLYLLPLDRVIASTRVAADAAQAVAGPRGASLISALVILSAIGVLNGVILAGPRTYYAMAKEGLAFRWLGSLRHAIVLQAVWSLHPGRHRHLPRPLHPRHLHRVALLRADGHRPRCACAGRLAFVPAHLRHRRRGRRRHPDRGRPVPGRRRACSSSC